MALFSMLDKIFISCIIQTNKKQINNEKDNFIFGVCSDGCRGKFPGVWKKTTSKTRE